MLINRAETLLQKELISHQPVPFAREDRYSLHAEPPSIFQAFIEQQCGIALSFTLPSYPNAMDDHISFSVYRPPGRLARQILDESSAS